MYEYKLYLQDYDLETVHDLLVSSTERYHYSFTTTETVKATTKRKLEIPVGLAMELKLDTGVCIKVTLTNASEADRILYKQGHVLTFGSEDDSTAASIDAIAISIKQGLVNQLPVRFHTMEHFQSSLRIPMSTKLSHLTDNLLLTALSAADGVMAGFATCEKVNYEYPEMSQSLSYNRVEVKENEFSYVPINDFQIYKKDNMVVALGITVGGSDFGEHLHYYLTGWFDAEHSEQIMKLFGENFEKAMFSGLPLKGGKFTGDQKIIKLGTKFSLDDVVLEQSVKDKLVKEVFNFFEMEPWYRKAGLPFKRGVALYGEAGTGKTMIAKILASTIPQTVIWVRAGDMVDLNDMNRVFRLARLGSPSVLFLEDIDFYAADRDTGKSNGLGIANMLGQLDGLEENDGILVIITTNRLETVEKAIIDRPGRIDVKIYIGELGKGKIIELLKKKLKAFKMGFSDWEAVIPLGTLMTGAQAVEFSTMIMRYAISEVSTTTIQEMLITESSVKKALKDIERAQNSKRISGFKHD